MSSKKLMRSRDDKMLFGVAAGLAQYLGIDPSIVRLAWVVAILLPGPNILIIAIYALMAFLMPSGFHGVLSPCPSTSTAVWPAVVRSTSW